MSNPAVAGGRGAAEFADLQFVVLSGPSGTGKTTIVEELLRRSPVRLMKSVSATTRAPRRNEKHGEDYYFISADEFADRRQRGEFLEYAQVHSMGNWYGTLKSEVQRARNNAAWALLEIDVQGAEQIRDAFPKALTIFVKAGSLADYENRLRARNTDTEEVIQRRLKTAEHELSFADRYRYQVVNNHLDTAIQEIINIIQAWEQQQHA